MMATLWPGPVAALEVAPFATLADEPVTVADVLAHLKWPSGSPDEVNIPRWIAAARRQIEHLTNLALVAQVWDLFFDDVGVAPGYVRLLLSPATSALVWTGSGGTETPIDAATFGVLAARPSRLLFSTAPDLSTSGGMRVRVTYAKPDVPPDLTLALLMLVADYALHRGDETERTDERTEAGAADLIERYIQPEV